MAERIYASRQTISNWETGRTYPDVQSLLLLSVAFNISIDKLIKGDVNITEETVRKTDHGLIWINAAKAPLTVAAIVSMFFAFDNLAGGKSPSALPFLLCFPATFATALGLSFAAKRIKAENDIVAYREILSFCQGKKPNRSSRYSVFVRTHRSVHETLLVVLGAIFGAIFIIVLRFVF